MQSNRRLKMVNIARVLRNVWKSPGITRIELSRELGLNKATISNIAAGLLEKGLILENGMGDSAPKGGRRPLPLVVNDDYGVIFGVEIQTEVYTASMISFTGKVVSQWAGTINFDSTIEQTLEKVCRDLKEKAGTQGLKVLGISLGLPGVVDTEQGCLITSRPLDISKAVSLSKPLSEKLDVPVLIENDANCCCWGEVALHGRGGDFAFVLGELRRRQTGLASGQGVGVGIGIVLNGGVHHGADHTAGEFNSILNTRKGEHQFERDSSNLFASGRSEETLFHVVEELAAHIGHLVNMLNLKTVVLGGFFESWPDKVLSVFDDAVQKNWPYDDRVECGIEFSSFGQYAVSAGAAGMFLEYVFTIPDLESDSVIRAYLEDAGIYAGVGDF